MQWLLTSSSGTTPSDRVHSRTVEGETCTYRSRCSDEYDYEGAKFAKVDGAAHCGAA